MTSCHLTKGPAQYKGGLSGYDDIITIRLSWDGLVFIVGMPLLVRLYTGKIVYLLNLVGTTSGVALYNSFVSFVLSPTSDMLQARCAKTEWHKMTYSQHCNRNLVSGKYHIICTYARKWWPILALWCHVAAYIWANTGLGKAWGLTAPSHNLKQCLFSLVIFCGIHLKAN